MISNIIINKDICVLPNSSIKNALKVIQKNSERICFVINKNNTLIASISDGDIRRGLIAGKKLEDKINNIKNTKYKFLQIDLSPDEAYKKFPKNINLLPVIGKKRKFLGIIRKQDLVPYLDIKSKKILILGLGYVGLTLALVLAETGFKVVGYDKNKKLLNKISKKKSPFYEKGLDRYLEENYKQNFRVSDKPIVSDIYIVSVGTPLTKSGKKPNLSNLKQSILSICPLLKVQDLIILRSTVPVGCTRDFVIKIIEKKTKLKFGKDIFISFCPERTVEGQAIEELKRLPQIVGNYCKKSSELTQKIFSEYNSTVIEVESLESAELAKLIDNSYRDTIFAYSNQLSKLSEKLNLNLVDIIEKVNLGYERNNIPKPSPGVGGPCLSKDSYILSSNFDKLRIGGENLIFLSRKVNESMTYNLFSRIKKKLGSLKKNKNCKIFMTGFAFKGFPETSDMRSSTTLDLLHLLKKNKYSNIWGHDYKVSSKHLKNLKIRTCSIDQGFKDADAVLIMNNHQNYAKLNIYKLLKKINKPMLFLDSWQIFEPLEINSINGISYISVGKN
tara:strand:- start:3344 stop:5020 length:1677 start_codon:yes stop_codon:yes gene_type:complete